MRSSGEHRERLQLARLSRFQWLMLLENAGASIVQRVGWHFISASLLDVSASVAAC
jgi:hypothetical protein